MEDVTTTVTTPLEVSPAAVILDMSWMMMDSRVMVCNHLQNIVFDTVHVCMIVFIHPPIVYMHTSKCH